MTSISLPSILDVAAATALADTLRAIAGPIRVDGSAVERIGVAGLQVLLSARATGAAGGTPVTIADASEALRDAADLCGAARLFAQAA